MELTSKAFSSFSNNISRSSMESLLRFDLASLNAADNLFSLSGPNSEKLHLQVIQYLINFVKYIWLKVSMQLQDCALLGLIILWNEYYMYTI